MKNKIKLLFSASILAVSASAQVSTPNNNGISANYVGWDNTNAFPLQIRHNANQEIHTYTNNLLRMKIANGGGFSNVGGNVAFGNNLATGFTPVDRLHLYNSGSLSALFTGVRLNNSNIGAAVTDGSQLGVDFDGVFFHRQYETQPIIFELPDSRSAGVMTNWLHISNGLTGYAGDITDGFIGLNEPEAKFHLDIKTPFINFGGGTYGGELFLSCRPSDVPDSRMGMLNIAGGNGVFSPSLFGNIDDSQTGSALNTLAVIHQD